MLAVDISVVKVPTITSISPRTLLNRGNVTLSIEGDNIGTEIDFINDSGIITKGTTNVPVSLLTSSTSIFDFPLADYFEVLDGEFLTSKAFVFKGQIARIPIAKGFAEGECTIGETCREGDMIVCEGKIDT